MYKPEGGGKTVTALLNIREEIMFTATEKQIQDWKKKYQEVFELTVEDKRCYLAKPNRQALSYAMTLAGTNPIGMAEQMLEDSWIDGDTEIKTEDTYFFGAMAQLGKFVEARNSELKNL